MPFSSSAELLRFVLFHRFSQRLAILLCSLFAAVFGLLGPFFQKEFIDHLTHTSNTFEKSWPFLLEILPTHTPWFIVLSFICILLSLAFSAASTYIGSREAIIMQKILAHHLYEKTLDLRADSLGGKASGELVSVYATDINHGTVVLEQSLPVGSSILFPMILAPMALVWMFDIPLWPTLTVIGFLILLNLIMAFRQSLFFLQFKKLAADRTSLVSEWVQNMRSLRILGWIAQFEKKIFKVRMVETKNRIDMVTNGQIMNSMNSSVTFLLNVGVLVLFIENSHQELSTGTLLALLWIVAVFLTKPFRQLPWFFTFVFDSWTSLRRVYECLSLENKNTTARDVEFKKLKSLSQPEPVLKVEKLNLHIASATILKNVSFELKYGEFLCVVGEVGSGKSMLLLSLLGETGSSFEEYKIGENDAKTLALNQLRQFFTFVPQEGFIMSASLRENVAFDYNVSKDIDPQIEKALAHAEFHQKLERMEHGLDTEIGERGVNMSGGQRQRVSLARIDYYQSPIVLLDDCLSAVDVDTENHLIKDLIRGAWKGRSILLVTHRLSVLEKADRILFMKNGAIEAQGTFDQLIANSEDFRLFAASVMSDKPKPQPEPPPETEALPQGGAHGED